MLGRSRKDCVVVLTNLLDLPHTKLSFYMCRTLVQMEKINFLTKGTGFELEERGDTYRLGGPATHNVEL